MDGKSHWLEIMNEEDLSFLKRFVLNSGSLKETARAYAISYPTVRLRLDRLIAKVEASEAASTAGPFERRLRAMFAEGRLDDSTFEELLRAHRNEGPTQ